MIFCSFPSLRPSPASITRRTFPVPPSSRRRRHPARRQSLDNSRQVRFKKFVCQSTTYWTHRSGDLKPKSLRLTARTGACGASLRDIGSSRRMRNISQMLPRRSAVVGSWVLARSSSIRRSVSARTGAHPRQSRTLPQALPARANSCSKSSSDIGGRFTSTPVKAIQHRSCSRLVLRKSQKLSASTRSARCRQP